MVDSFVKFLQFEKRYSAHTIAAYSQDLDQLQQFLSQTFEINNPETAGHIHLRSWVVDLMEKGHSSRTVNRKIATLKSFYKFLQRREYISQNPASRLRPLKTEKKLPAFVRENEMINLLDRIEFTDDFTGQRDRLILELLYGTGIRLSELIHLKDRDWNEFQQSIKVLGKRDKERVIPVPQSIVKVIKDYQRLRDREVLTHVEGYLLVTEDAQMIYPMMVYRMVREYLQKVTTISKRSPHVLRHTFATHLLNKGADLNAVKDLLGHTSLAATQVYTHNSIEKLKSVFDQAHPKA